MKKTILTILLSVASSITFHSVCNSAELVPLTTDDYQQIQFINFSSPDKKVIHKAELFGPFIGGIKRGKFLKIDDKLVDQNRYFTSRIMLGDVTNDQLDEVFFYQYSPGSAGAMGLNVYSLINSKWSSIFNEPSNTHDNNETERFSNEYLTNNRIRFYDKRTDLSGVIDISRFKFSEERLRTMSLKTDPISEYVIHYENIGCGIETIQWIFAFSHPNAVFSLHNHYIYKFDEHKFSLYETRIQDNDGAIITRKKYY
ncbi:hypothetical protein QFZ81_004017 [Paenibacillus sp. V4I9]|uniref:hypothetical protein n=1 Tax=Paenibacillus sp. V4I9 TaxID=3042308 RepID=UPI002785FDB9|nr:hypothetical protein [Paenibacillus sp. V4I9]MDQ0888929.1 hypothetical protein [Paenibacillus sp. V4I9]